MKSHISHLRQFVLLCGDAVCLFLGLLAALAIRYGASLAVPMFEVHWPPFVVIFAVWVFCFYIGGVYGLRRAKNERSFFTLFLIVFGVNAGIAVFFFYFIPYFTISPKTVLFLDLGITLALFLAWRTVFNKYVSLPPLRVAVLGEGPEVKELIEDFENHPQQGYRCIFTAKGGETDLSRLLHSRSVDIVAVAVDYRNSPELQKILFECIPLHIQFFNFVDFYEQRLQKIPLAVIDQAWFLENLNEPGKQFFSGLKRFLDIIFAVAFGVAGLALSPFIALAILIDSGRPVLYSQMRIGSLGKPFRIYKFRSMSGDEKTVTSVGRFIRATHLDEIPQLWNIIRGDMSFVGPRPEREHFVEDLKKRIPFYAERLLVRPGITGWAQLHEPCAKVEDAISKLQYDLFYIKHRSPLLDIEIILKTLRILVV